MTHSAINLAQKLTLFDDHWSPRIITRLNDYEVKVVKVEGEFVWHKHDDTDELFIVLDGELVIEMQDGDDVPLAAGELFVVPAGAVHRPVAQSECHILLLEPSGVVNTGDAGGELTAQSDTWI